MNLPTASNILFLWNKVNSLLSPWHTTPAIVSRPAHFKLKHWKLQYKLHLYAIDSPCPNTATFSVMSLLQRSDTSAVWAIKQRQPSHLLFITTDCYLAIQLPPPCLHVFLCRKSPHFAQLLLFHCWFPSWAGARKCILCISKNRKHAGTYIHMDSQYTSCTHVLHECEQSTEHDWCHVQVTTVTCWVSFCHPLQNNG